jgi:hypothetical protein
MKVLCLFSFAILAAPSTVDAAAWASNVVECSKITTGANVTFQACATTEFHTPIPSVMDGVTTLSGGYLSSYRITQGLKKGVGVDETNEERAYRSGISIDVNRADDDSCTVTVDIKGKSTQCKSCKHCGNHKFTADCTNVANGRKTKCESALGSQDAGKSKIFFPLKKAALSVKAPTAAAVKTPVAAPIKK